MTDAELIHHLWTHKTENHPELSDEDLLSIFAYLQSIPAVSNRVPEPLPPAETR